MGWGCIIIMLVHIYHVLFCYFYNKYSCLKLITNISIYWSISFTATPSAKNPFIELTAWTWLHLTFSVTKLDHPIGKRWMISLIALQIMVVVNLARKVFHPTLSNGRIDCVCLDTIVKILIGQFFVYFLTFVSHQLPLALQYLQNIRSMKVLLNEKSEKLQIVLKAVNGPKILYSKVILL